MSRYIQIEFPSVSTEQKEILIAELAEINFEGFEESDTGLKAFATANNFDEEALSRIASQQTVPYNKNIIEETNWNKLWESNFQPIVVDDFVAIRAAFHDPMPGTEHELVITPQMSFGTGHHATTYMMIQQMRQIDFRDKIVLDFGTGTGILAILAEKLGAARIIAIDKDDWSIENAEENSRQNNCSLIELQKSDKAGAGITFDIILANINKDVILDNLSSLTGQLAKNGTLVLSGILPTDENDIFRKTGEYSLQLTGG